MTGFRCANSRPIAHHPKAIPDTVWQTQTGSSTRQKGGWRVRSNLIYSLPRMLKENNEHLKETHAKLNDDYQALAKENRELNSLLRSAYLNKDTEAV